MLKNILFYLKRHPVVDDAGRADFSFFPSDQRLKPYINRLMRSQSTPAFVLDTKVMLHRLMHAEAGLGMYWKSKAIAYSFKTNYSPAAYLKRYDGVYADVGSGRELMMALDAGYSGDRIIFNGPNKTHDAVMLAKKHNVLVQIDNPAELMNIYSVFKSSREPIRFGVRLNLTGHSMNHSHFGFVLRELFSPQVIKILKTKTSLAFQGVHFHSGSDIDDLSVFEKAASIAGDVVSRLRAEGISVRYLNAGGGIKSHGLKPYGRTRWNDYEFDQYASVLWTALTRKNSNVDKCTIVIEPGRYLVDDATVLATKVFRVTAGVKQAVYVDGSNAMLPLSHYRPQIPKVFSSSFSPRKTRGKPTIIYGATLREDDVLFRGWLPAVAVGDAMLFYCVGAYNSNLAPDFIFDKPKTYLIKSETRV